MSTVVLSQLLALFSHGAARADVCVDAFSDAAKSYETRKSEIKTTRPFADRARGLVQITGKDLEVGQKDFPRRTPADPVVFMDPKTGEALVYGTQVDGTGFSYLKFPSKNDMLRGAEPKIIAKEVYLPNGKIARGQEAIWDTNRLEYSVLAKVFSKEALETAYRENGITPGSDLFFGGIALQPNGELGRWTTDNWRRRVHTIADVDGRLQILETPVFNEVSPSKTEASHPGFGHLPFLPGDYIGHAYGPNFKLVKNGKKTELWIISEEVTRRVLEKGIEVEVTEIVARKMLTPFRASEKTEVLVTVNGPDGKPHRDSDRGAKMAHTKLIEGFRPTHLEAEGLTITKRQVRKNGRLVLASDPSLAKEEFHVMTGSQGNFAGDGYDAILAVRRGGPIGPYKIITTASGTRWKRYLADIKKKYRLSWAGRATFVKEGGDWWLVFHAVDKDLKPDGSYSGVIPPNTAEYHRNIYAVPIEFFVNLKGDPDMRVLM